MSDKTFAENYYRKSALVTKIFKYITVFLFIVFLISCIVIFRRDITVQNIQLLAKYFSLEGSSSNYSDEFSVSCSDDCIPIMLRDNLGVIDKNNISLYDLSGQKLFSFNYAYSAPAVVYDNHSILVYDVKGTELSLFNSFSKLKNMSFDGGISCADINENSFAVVYRDDSNRSVLSVYDFSSTDNDYLEVFKFSTSSAFLTSVALSDNSRYVLTTGTESKGGNYSSTVMVYDSLSSSVDPLFSTEIVGELPIHSGFADNTNSLFVVTDSGILFFDFSLEQSSYFKFNQSKIDNFYIGDDLIVVSERNNLAGNSMLLTGISKGGDIIFKMNVQDQICDICFGKNSIFALGKNDVFKIDFSYDGTNSVKSATVNEKYHHIVADTDNNCYILNDTIANKVIFNEG